MSNILRRRYGVKLLVGYATVAVFILSVGFVTDDAAATMMASVAGLLTLGSITGTTTIATLRRIERDAAAIADGNLKTEVHANRHDEFGRLSMAIDQMRRSLRDRITEL